MYLGLIPFAVGLIGLVGFWFFRHWEERRVAAGRGARIWSAERQALDAAVAEGYRRAVAGDAFRSSRTHLFSLLWTVFHRALVALVALIRAVERPLARVSYRMRMAPPKVPGREPSQFLKTITPDKKPESAGTTDTL